MKNWVLSLVSLFFLTQATFAQESTGGVHLVRSGVSVTRTGEVTYSSTNVINLVSHQTSLQIIYPTYTYLGKKLYFSVDVPQIRYSDFNGYKFFSASLNPAIGYVFMNSTKKFRPYVAGVLSINHSHEYEAQNIFGDTRDTWDGLETVNLRLGAFYRISARFFLDIALDSPTGHTLFVLPSGTGTRYSTKFFQNTYATYLPKVQLGISYQIK
jgi:hypothetical protein